MSIPVLILRDARSSAAMCAGLNRQGFEAIAAPCLEFRTVEPDPGALAGWLATELDLLVTSPRSLPVLRGVALAPRWRILALAPTTAAALRGAGIVVHAETNGGGAALAALTRPGPVLLATSDIGGDEVLKVRPDTLIWITYRTVCPDDLPAPARAALRGTYDIYAASPSALRNLDHLAPGAVRAARCVTAHGGTTVAQALALGAERVVEGPLSPSPEGVEP